MDSIKEKIMINYTPPSDHTHALSSSVSMESSVAETHDEMLQFLKKNETRRTAGSFIIRS